MILLIFFIAFVFVFLAPIYLKRNAGNIKPSKNVFEKFVDSDQGYPWSQSKERRDSYQKRLNEKRKKNIK